VLFAISIAFIKGRSYFEVSPQLSTQRR